jgi:predicted nucleic acid-binding protein
VLPPITILPYDVDTARVFGSIRSELEGRGVPLADADLQIAATAINHELALVTGNLRHFERFPELRIERAFAELRNAV